MLIDFKNCNDLIQILHGAPVRKIYHVGAHIGEEADAYSAEGVTDIIWFEANDSLIPSLHQNLSRFSMRQTIVPLALFDENKTLTFNITNNLQSSSLFNLGTHSMHYPQIVVTESKSVKAYRLDTLIDNNPDFLPWSDFDFINIDTQGAEMAVLKGLGRHIDNPSIKGIFLEINAEQLYCDIPLVEDIDSYLLLHHFHRINTNWTKAKWGDAFYIKSKLLAD